MNLRLQGWLYRYLAGVFLLAVWGAHDTIQQNYTF